MTVTPKVAANAVAHFPFLYILSCGHFTLYLQIGMSV